MRYITHNVKFLKNRNNKWRAEIAHTNGHIIFSNGQQGYDNLTDAQTAFRNVAHALRWGRYTVTVDHAAHGIPDVVEDK